MLQTRSDDLFLRIGGVKTRADWPSGCIDASWRPICTGPLQVEGRSVRVRCKLEADLDFSAQVGARFELAGASWTAIWALLRKSDPARASDMPSVAIRVQPRYGPTLDAGPHTGARLGSQRALLLVYLQDGHEGLLGHFHVADGLHALLAGLLLFEQLALTRNIAAVALCRHVLAHGLHRLAGDDLGTDGGLYGDVELLARDELLELLAHLAAEVVGVVGIDQRREGIHRFAVEQDVELGQLAGLVSRAVVVERRITFRYALELVVEVEDDLRKGHVEIDLHAVLRDESLVLQHAALVDAELDDVAEEFGLRDDLRQDVGLLDPGDLRHLGQSRGVVHLQHLVLRGGDAVRNVRHGRDDVHVELTVEALLDDLHVQQAEETAAEAESERQRALGLESQRGVVEPQLFERRAQVLVLVGLHRVDAREDHRLHVLEARDGLRRRIGHRRDGVADLHVGRGLDARADVAHVARGDALARMHLELQHAHLVGVVLAAGVEELHVVALAQRAVEHAVVGDDAAEGVEHRVEDQRLQRGVHVALRRRHTLHDGFEHLLDALSRLARGEQNLLLAAADQVDHLVLHLVDHGRIHVDLVQHGNDLQVVAERQIEIRYGLGLNALRGIDHQQRTLARGDGARHLVRKIDVSRRVDQVQNVRCAVLVLVGNADGLRLDRDAAFALQIHRIEQLILHFTF